MISLQIQQLSNWGIKKFVVITNPAFDELIRNDLKNNHPNKDIKYTIQDKPLGIAHALKQAKNCVEIESKILFILGDNFFGENPILNINLPNGIEKLSDKEIEENLGKIIKSTNKFMTML